MSLAEIPTFDKKPEAGFLERLRPFLLVLIILLTATLAFAVGRLTAGGTGEPVKVLYDASLSEIAKPSVSNTQPAAAVKAIPKAGEVVTSKNGTKYHFPSCPGAKQIKEENKVYFPSPEAAEKAGYTLAANCKTQ